MEYGEWKVRTHGITYQIFTETNTRGGSYQVAEGIYRKANAHLIAAAPELCEAGKKLVKWLHMLADTAERKAKTGRFITLKEAWEADAKNYRATARDMEQALAKVNKKGDN